jgi:CBS domain-containing protein
LIEAEHTMRHNQVRRLPVVNTEGKLVGLLSLADIAREAERERPEPQKQVPPEEVTDVLADVSRPRERARAR